MHAFTDAFQGWFKDGTNGTRDFRYFAGFYLIFRIVILVEVAVSTYYIWMIIILCPIIASLMFALLRPYKNDWLNILDSLLFAILALAIFFVMYNRRVAPVPLQLVYSSSDVRPANLHCFIWSLQAGITFKKPAFFLSKILN